MNLFHQSKKEMGGGTSVILCSREGLKYVVTLVYSTDIIPHCIQLRNAKQGCGSRYYSNCNVMDFGNFRSYTTTNIGF